jgi:uncharacterized protein HemX
VSPATATLLAAIAAALISAGTVVYTVRQRRKDREHDEQAKREEAERRADPELAALERAAYERARASYEAALRTAQTEARRVEERLQEVEERANTANRRASSAEAEARATRRTLDALRVWLRQNGVAIPAHLDGDADPDPQERT